jgi:hypothetical protein
MLGDDRDRSDNVYLFDELRHALEKGGGGNGGDGNGGGDGSDPYERPATVRELIAAVKQVGEAARTMVMTAAKQQADVTLEATEMLANKILQGREADQERSLDVARGLLENTMTVGRGNTDLARVLNDRFEAFEKRLLALEKRLGGQPVNCAGEDAGGGP